MSAWYQQWFNEDYLHLYHYRNESEAEAQVDFLFKKLSILKSDRVLDLACGAGRHSIALAKRGVSVLGIDSSSFLINEAKKLQENHPSLRLKFQQGDMRDLSSFFHQFDDVISMFTSFGYFESDKENEKVIRNVYGCLKSQGKFFLDYINPDALSLKKNFGNEEKLMVRGEEVTIKHRKVDAFIIKDIHFPGRQYQEKVHLYDHFTLKSMLQRQGFRVENCWSNYDGKTWSPDGERQLFYCIAE